MENHKLVLPEHLNHYGYLFGGYLLKWVDEYAWIAASLDYPDCNFVTVALDKVEFKKSGDTAEISIKRQTEGTTFWKGTKSEWEMALSPDVEYTIDLDYGAAEMIMDLRGLKIEEIDMDMGASGNTIWFEDYPTRVTLDTGASSIKFKFPDKYGVIIEIDGGDDRRLP